jgi:hypothetical protein
MVRRIYSMFSLGDPTQCDEISKRQPASLASHDMHRGTAHLGPLQCCLINLSRRRIRTRYSLSCRVSFNQRYTLFLLLALLLLCSYHSTRHHGTETTGTSLTRGVTPMDQGTFTKFIGFPFVGTRFLYLEYVRYLTDAVMDTSNEI